MTITRQALTTAELFDYAKTQAAACFNEYGGHTPLILAEIPGRGVMIMPLDFTSDEAKEQSLAAAKLMLAMAGCTKTVFISEAWLAKVGPEWMKDQTRARDLPQREEVLTVHCEERGQQFAAGHYPIIREGEKARVGEWVQDLPIAIEGNMVGLTDLAHGPLHS